MASSISPRARRRRRRTRSPRPRPTRRDAAVRSRSLARLGPCARRRRHGRTLPQSRTWRMKLTLLGTGGPIPDPTRHGSAVALEIGERAPPVRCRPRRRPPACPRRIPVEQVHPVFITHHHYDHIGDLGGRDPHRLAPGPEAALACLRSTRHRVDRDGPHRAGVRAATSRFARRASSAPAGRPSRARTSSAGSSTMAAPGGCSPSRWRTATGSTTRRPSGADGCASATAWRPRARSSPSAGTASPARASIASPGTRTCWSSAATWPGRSSPRRTSSASPGRPSPARTPWAGSPGRRG